MTTSPLFLYRHATWKYKARYSCTLRRKQGPRLPSQMRPLLAVCSSSLSSQGNGLTPCSAALEVTHCSSQVLPHVCSLCQHHVCREATASGSSADAVRAPIPIKKDTLYGDAMPQFLRHQARSRYASEYLGCRNKLCTCLLQLSAPRVHVIVKKTLVITGHCMQEPQPKSGSKLERIPGLPVSLAWSQHSDTTVPAAMKHEYRFCVSYAVFVQS